MGCVEARGDVLDDHRVSEDRALGATELQTRGLLDRQKASDLEGWRVHWTFSDHS